MYQFRRVKVAFTCAAANDCLIDQCKDLFGANGLRDHPPRLAPLPTAPLRDDEFFEARFFDSPPCQLLLIIRVEIPFKPHLELLAPGEVTRTSLGLAKDDARRDAELRGKVNHSINVAPAWQPAAVSLGYEGERGELIGFSLRLVPRPLKKNHPVIMQQHMRLT